MRMFFEDCVELAFTDFDWSRPEPVAHVCFRSPEGVEQTPGWGHSIVRCVTCWRPGIRTWSLGVQVVTWEDEL